MMSAVLVCTAGIGEVHSMLTLCVWPVLAGDLCVWPVLAGDLCVWLVLAGDHGTTAAGQAGKSAGGDATAGDDSKKSGGKGKAKGKGKATAAKGKKGGKAKQEVGTCACAMHACCNGGGWRGSVHVLLWHNCPMSSACGTV